MLTGNPSNGRGCGTRTSGGCYLCCGTSAHGIPIEKFILDPVRFWPGDFQRGFKILPAPQGHNNVVIFIGEGFYASPWAFIEEAKRFGVSRKVTPTFPFEQLTPGKSYMLLVHPSAYVSPIYYPYFNTNEDGPLNQYCPLKDLPLLEGTTNRMSSWHPPQTNAKPFVASFCTYAHKNLAYWFHDRSEKLNFNDQFTLNLASFSFSGKVPHVPIDIEEGLVTIQSYLEPGIFMAVPLTHVEFPRKENKSAKRRINQAGYETVVVEY